MLYDDICRVGAGLSLSFSPLASLGYFTVPLSRSHRIVSLSPHRVTLSLGFFSSFSSRSYSREVAPSSHERGVGWKERAVFSPRSPARYTHIYTYGVGGGRRRGSERWRKLSHDAAHRWLRSVVHWAFAEWENYSLPCVRSSHSPYIYYADRPTVWLFSLLFLARSPLLFLSFAVLL